MGGGLSPCLPRTLLFLLLPLLLPHPRRRLQTCCGGLCVKAGPGGAAPLPSQPSRPQPEGRGRRPRACSAAAAPVETRCGAAGAGATPKSDRARAPCPGLPALRGEAAGQCAGGASGHAWPPVCRAPSPAGSETPGSPARYSRKGGRERGGADAGMLQPSLGVDGVLPG